MTMRTFFPITAKFLKQTLPIIMMSFFILFMIVSTYCLADDAMVLPKGIWMTSAGVDIYPYWGSEYNDQGHAQGLAYDYNRGLDSAVFKILSNFEGPSWAPYGLAPDYRAYLGQSIVEFKKRAAITNIVISRGITDTLSIGLKIPFWHFRTKVKANLDNSNATIARNPKTDRTSPFYDPNLPLPNTPIVQIPFLSSLGFSEEAIDQIKLTRQDILDLLSNGIQELGIDGFGYENFQTWSGEDIGDIELGMKYQYLKDNKWQLSLQGGIRFPTGRVDDPDNLVDYGFGGGNYDIFLAFQNDFLGFKDMASPYLKNFVPNATIRYTCQLPDKETLRVPDDPNDLDIPLTESENKRSVDRDLGDILEVEFSLNYKLPEGFGLNLTYGGFFKGKDSMKVAGVHSLNLEHETTQVGHTALFGISYSNLHRYQAGISQVPFQLSLSHWYRFAGKNLNKAKYFSLKGTLFF